MDGVKVAKWLWLMTLYSYYMSTHVPAHLQATRTVMNLMGNAAN